MIKKFAFVVGLLLVIGLTNADELTEAYKVVVDQEAIIVKQEIKINKLEERDKARYLIRLPFTKIGITKSAGNGFITGCIFTIILL